MSTRTRRILSCCLCLVLLPCAKSMAQDGGDREREHDRPGAPGGPGGPGGVGGTGGPRQLHHGDKGKNHLARAPHNALQFGPVGRWWDDRSVAQSIGLRREQQRRMDSIFDAHKQAILDNYKGFLKAQSNLSAVNKDPQADKDRVFAAIDEVNQARSSLQKATSAMLLQIRQEMDPEQVTKLEQVQ